MKNKLALAVGAAMLAGATANTYAIGSGYNGITMTGNAPVQYHNLSSQTNVCPTDCQAQFAQGQEIAWTFRVNAQKNQALYAPGASFLDAPVAPAPVAQTYTSTTAGGSDPLSQVDLARFHYYLPNFPCVADLVCDPTNGVGLYSVDGAASFTTEGFNFNTDAEGFITDGWIVASTPFGAGVVFNVVFDFNSDGSVDFSAYTGTVSGVLNNIDDIRNDINFCDGGVCNVGGDTVSDLSGAALAEDAVYETADINDGSGAKAVPVPAFAAAALGLGLIGVTALTSRRRIK